MRSALGEVLRELAGGAFGYNNRNRHHRSKSGNHRLQQIVQPYIDVLLPMLTPPAKSPDERLVSHPTSPGFRPVHYPIENA